MNFTGGEPAARAVFAGNAARLLQATIADGGVLPMTRKSRRSATPAKQSRAPRPSRPEMDGYGVPPASKGMLPWRWAHAHLTKSHNYWLVTARRDGAPHAMPVWGVWVGDAWYFSTNPTSRKGHNISSNPRCVVCSENAAQAVILEGTARMLAAEGVPREVPVAYHKKYGFELQGSVFEVRPRVVFAMPEKQFPAAVTRWTFE